jgi:hypothetical protein
MTKNTEVQTSFEEHPDQGQMMRAALAVSTIGQMNWEIRDLQNRLVHEVSIARENGASWTAIGDALHVSRSAAQKYYGELI